MYEYFRNFPMDFCVGVYMPKYLTKELTLYQYDIVVVDTFLDQKDDLERIIDEIKAFNDRMPIFAINGTGDADVTLKLFGMGATDVQSFPLNYNEAAARFKAIYSRTAHKTMRGIFQIGDRYTLYSSGHLLMYKPSKEADNSSVICHHLTPLQCDILTDLARDINRPLYVSELIEKHYGSHTPSSSRAFRVYISKLREMLRKDESVLIVRSRKYQRIMLVSYADAIKINNMVNGVLDEFKEQMADMSHVNKKNTLGKSYVSAELKHMTNPKTAGRRNGLSNEAAFAKYLCTEVEALERMKQLDRGVLSEEEITDEELIGEVDKIKREKETSA